MALDLEFAQASNLVAKSWRSGAVERSVAHVWFRGALQAIDAALKPAGFDSALQKVIGLHVAMPRQNREETDTKLMLRVMAEDVAEYPEDILADACRVIRRSEDWFPPISKIVAVCDEQLNRRRRWRARIRNLAIETMAIAKEPTT